jgi:hypothetical protein
MSNLFEYDYTIDAGNLFYLDDIINSKTYKTMFCNKYISFLNKGLCGNGGTTGFVQYALKNNKGCLLLVPNRSIVMSKEDEYKDNREVCCVYGGSGSFDRDARIVIATYDQFPRLLSELSYGGFTITEDPWDSEFWSGRTIILDEYHKLVDECGFRDATCFKITDLIKNTDNGVVLMSATPHWGYIDFIRELVKNRDIITFNINYEQGYEKLIQVYDVKKKDLSAILNKVKKVPENKHICVFYNSVKGGITDLLDQIGEDDCEVLCSINNEKDLGNYFSKTFNDNKRLHFLTSAFFTGQDIRVPIRQCIIIGSKESENMCLGERDIKQIIGRFRKGVEGIHLFYLAAKTQLSNYQPVKDNYDRNIQILEALGDNWTSKPATIHLNQDTIRLKDTLERFEYWSSKQRLIKRLEDYGYVVKPKKIGDYEGVEKRRKLTFKEAQKRIADGQQITYDENKYGGQIKEYMNEKGVEEMLNATRTTILDWYKIRKSVGISRLDLLTPEEKFKILGLEHFGRYKARYLMNCLKYLGVFCEYEQLSVKMRENLGCYVARWKADPKGKAEGAVYIVYMKMKGWEASHKGTQTNIEHLPKIEGVPHMISYQTEIKNTNCYGKTITLREAPKQYKSLSKISLYEWVNEEKAMRLPEVKGGEEWQKIKKYRQTKISEMFKDTDTEYRYNKSSMECVDCLIIDVDNGITFSDFKERYKDYVWVAYPTINNIANDWNKFRVIVPLKSRLKLNGEYNLMTLKMLRSIFCYFEDPNHQLASFINIEDWLKRKGNDGVLYDISQELVDDIMLSIRNSKELVMLRFDGSQADKNVRGLHRSSKDLNWAKEYFKASFELGDGERHKRLFVIKNNLNDKDRDLFQSWLGRQYPSRYLEKWKSHKVMKRS